jgi:hypothetical protein
MEGESLFYLLKISDEKIPDFCASVTIKDGQEYALCVSQKVIND